MARVTSDEPRRDEARTRTTPPTPRNLALARIGLIVGTPVVILIAALTIPNPGSSDQLNRFAFVCCCLILILSVMAWMRLEHLIERARDRWRADRRADRIGSPPSPTSQRLRRVEQRARARTRDGTHAEPAHPRVRVERRPAWKNALDWGFVAYLVGGYPVIGSFVHVPLSVITFVSLGMVFLAVVGYSERRSVRRRVFEEEPSSSADLEQRISRSRAWWAAAPPRALQWVRILFLVTATVGFFMLMIVPFLQGREPRDIVRLTRIYVGGFLIGLSILAVLERMQRARERAWLAEQDARRHSRSAG